jgi:K+-sensing histidine kinase KdpD
MAKKKSRKKNKDKKKRVVGIKAHNKKKTAKIKKLENLLKQKDDYISHLERVSDAYSQLEELARTELLEADKTIKAQQIIQDLMYNERVDADKTIKAHEQLQEVMRGEKAETEELIKAHESLENLANEEKKCAEETIRAFESMGQLSMIEKRDAEKVIRAREQLTNLSIEELRQKDTALRNILEVNRYISSFLEEDVLLNKILKSLVSSLHAQRGILFIEEKGAILPKIFNNIKKDELSKKGFELSSQIIDDTIENKKSRFVINEKINIDGKDTRISLISVPLIYESNLLGVLYVDIISESDTFKKIDLDLAEIFSLQAAISIHNAILYEKIKKQNKELLRLNNLKNQFIRHVSDKLDEPMKAIQTLIKKLTTEELDPQKQNQLLKNIKASLDKMSFTVTKVITIISLEREVEDLFVDNVDIDALIRELVKKHSQEIKERDISFKIELPSQFKSYNANLTLMKTIFDELICNSIFYNKKGGSVEIRGYRKGSHLAIDFIDNGLGIKKEDIQNIFLQFYRTEDSPQLNEWGAGLGLYMVKIFIEHYSGDVTVKSEYGKGSTFTVTLLLQ